jgi:hypothetical protein
MEVKEGGYIAGIDLEIAEIRLSYVPTRPGAWNSPWRAYQKILQCYY